MLLALCLSPTIFAALPPFAQSKREILAILNSNELAQYFNSAEAIKSIKHYESSYTVSSNKKEIVIDIIYPESTERKAGPIEFELLFHPVNLP